MSNYFIIWLCSLLLIIKLTPVYAHASDPDLEKLASILSAQSKTIANSRVAQPDASGITTRAPAGPRLYKQTVSGTALVVTYSGHGSGVRVANALLVTNWHVIQGHEYAAVLFWQPHLTDLRAIGALDDKAWILAKVIESDPTRDLALLSINPTKTPPNAIIIESANLSDLSVGQDVFAIGHPEYLFWSYTEGVVSQIRPNYSWKSELGTHKATVIQTQTPIGFGSSGGPLFDQRGRLVGLTTASRAPGLYFAIAVNEINAFLFEAMSRRKR